MKWKKPGLFEISIIGISILAIVGLLYVFLRSSTYITVTLKVGPENIYWDGGATKTWFSQYFYKGMKEQNGFGKSFAEVLSIRSYDSSPTTKSVYLTLKLQVVYNRSSNQYTFRGKPLLVGSSVRVYLDRLLVDGLVTYIDGIPNHQETKKFRLTTELREENNVFPETSGVRNEIAEAIKGDEVIRDDQGNILLTIIKKTESPATKVVTTADGRVLTQIQPERMAVEIIMDVTAKKISNTYFIFDDIPLLVEAVVPVNLPFISIYPVITSIEEVK